MSARKKQILGSFPPYYLVGVLLLSVLMVYIVNWTGPYHLPEDPYQKIYLLQEANLHEEAVTIAEELLAQDPHNIALHRSYIWNHFEMSEEATNEQGELIRDDKKLVAYYEALSQQPETAGIGYYGLGYIHIQQEEYEEAIQDYTQVPNRQQPYLNNSIGHAYIELEQDDNAEPYLLKEIEIDGYLNGAVNNLAELYLRQDRTAEVVQILDDSHLAPHVSNYNQATLALQTNHWHTYLCFIVKGFFQRIDLNAFLSSMIICFMWLFYFWRIDIFKPKPTTRLLLVLGVGFSSVLWAFLLGDILAQIWLITMSGDPKEDLLFAIFHIGFVEEIAKFIPVLIVWIFIKIEEPIDLLIYGGLSALGFAVLENMLYISHYGVDISLFRWLTAASHIVNTSLICYLWAYARTIRHHLPLPYIILGICLSSLIHGIYDYFLMSFDGDYGWLSFILMLIMADIYGSMLRNALNFSPYFDEARAQSSRLSNYSLIFATFIILTLLSYLYRTFTYSTEIANDPILLIVLGFYMVLFKFTFTTLFKLEPTPNKLLPLYRGRKRLHAARHIIPLLAPEPQEEEAFDDTPLPLCIPFILQDQDFPHHKPKLFDI